MACVSSVSIVLIEKLVMGTCMQERLYYNFKFLGKNKSYYF